MRIFLRFQSLADQKASAAKKGGSIVTAYGSDESLLLKQALDCGICQAGVNVYSIGRAGISELML